MRRTETVAVATRKAIVTRRSNPALAPALDALYVANRRPLSAPPCDVVVKLQQIGLRFGTEHHPMRHADLLRGSLCRARTSANTSSAGMPRLGSASIASQTEATSSLSHLSTAAS